MLGQTLSRHQIVEEIGHSSMGHGYRGIETKLGHEVALKVLPPEMSDKPELGPLKRKLAFRPLPCLC